MGKKSEYVRVLDDAEIVAEAYGLDRMKKLVDDARNALEADLKAAMPSDTQAVDKSD